MIYRWVEKNTMTKGLQEHKRWAGRSTNWNQDCWEKYQNLRYTDDTILMTESEEELKSLLMKVKEESEKKAGLKQHSKN